MRPLQCDDCHKPLDNPFLSATGLAVRIAVQGKTELCPDCVLKRIKEVMGVKEEKE